MAIQILKPLTIAIAAGCWCISTTPPAPPPTSKDQVYLGTFHERFSAGAVWANKNYTIAVLMAEAAVYLAVAYPQVFPSLILSVLCPLGHPDSDALSTISLPFIVGFFFVLIGTSVRVWCYRTLGRHFTFEVTLLHDHQLVTDGPYAYVRHPSYGACIPLFGGMAMMVFAPYDWVAGQGILSTSLGVAIQLWLCMVAWVAYSLWSRMSVEDQNLRSRFGGVWENYAQNVPCKLIPGAY